MIYTPNKFRATYKALQKLSGKTEDNQYISNTFCSPLYIHSFSMFSSEFAFTTMKQHYLKTILFI